MTPEAAPADAFDERFFLDVPQHFKMQAPGEVTARMLAESLLGLEGIAKHSVDFLESYLDVKIKTAEVIVTDVEIGSIEDTWIFRIVFGKGRGAAKKFEALRAKLGVKNMEPEKMIGFAMMGLLLYATGKMHGAATVAAAPEATTHIENSFNTVSEGLNMPREELIALMSETVKNEEELKRDTIRLVNPDGQVRSGKIVFNQDEVTTLPPEVLEVVPAKYERAEDLEEPMRDYPAAEVSVRAMDLDKAGQGWWALAPAISDRRLPIVLGPGIDPLTIPYGKTIKADLTLAYKVDRQGNNTPKSLVLKRLRKEVGPMAAGE